MLKDLMIEKIKETNIEAVSNRQMDKVITRMYYKDYDGTTKFVEDFTPFTTGNYMTQDLKDALANGVTLSTRQQLELSKFIIEDTFH